MKNVLVVYYSQSGQLEEILSNITVSMERDPSIELTYYNIKMEKPFPFPWDGKSFFDAFPESFLEIPATIIAPQDSVMNKKYDLVILGYQVWYLSPSIPFNSFLKSSYAEQLLKDVPVVTVIGCRNMWVMAHEKVKQSLKSIGAELVGNIALVDRHINHVSVITIVQWMFTGEKKRYLGIFPKPGVSEKDIKGAKSFGEIIAKYIDREDYKAMQQELVNKGAVVIHWFLVKMDQTGNKTFRIWANHIVSKKGSREKWLKVFKAYLYVAIWGISPIVYILQLLFFPLNYRKIKKEDKYFKEV